MTAMHPLVEFLLARVAEDEAVARAASDQWADQEWDEIDEDQYLHIDRHHPTRVLAECQAKRQLIQRHRERDGADGARHPTAPDRCTECGQHAWPCPTLCALGAVYSQHYDYDESWRP